MKIKDMEIYKVKIPLKKKFVIATGFQNFYNGVLVKILASDGSYGWGEGVAMSGVLGETNDIIYNDLMRMRKKLKSSNVDPTDIEYFLEKFGTKTKGARAAVDIALHDLLGKMYGIPLEKILGGHKREIETCITIGIGDSESMLNFAKKYVDMGFKTLKIKIGTDSEKDIKKIGMIREAVGKRIKIRVDANQGYNKDDAVRVIEKLAYYDIEFIEQPVPADDLDAMKYVKNNSSIPIMADESVRNANEIINVGFKECADMFNLKVMKMGGVRGLLESAEAAKALDMPCQMGCVIETIIGISCGTRCALAFPAVRFADLDGHFDLKENIGSGGLRTKNGIHYPINGGGLGVKVDVRKIIKSGIIS